MQQTSINEIIISITNSFIKAKIPFCVAGGIAVSLWGHIRATEDIDIIALIDSDNENQIITPIFIVKYYYEKHFNNITNFTIVIFLFSKKIKR